MTISELEAMQAALTIKGAIVLLVVLSVCATILLVLALRRYSKDQDQEHKERMAQIQASREMGKTAWAQSDVHKSELIRQQAKELEELRAWKRNTEARLTDARLAYLMRKAEEAQNK